MSAFKSATTDFKALHDRRKDLFGEPQFGTENGVDTTKREEEPKPDPGHYCCYWVGDAGDRHYYPGA